MSSNEGGKGRWARAWVVVAGVLLLTACATVNKQHPLVLEGEVTEAQKAEVARVYFIRPKPYKSKGVADARVRISFQNETLLTQAEGNYSLLYIKPAMGLLKVHSETMFTDQAAPVEVWRAREYKFIAGKTYFIYVRQLNEEFRGVFYEPQPVSLSEAKQLIQPGGGFMGGTFATGAARSAPIDRLTEVDAPPASAVKELLPALPENIYKQEKYLYQVR